MGNKLKIVKTKITTMQLELRYYHSTIDDHN